jgi:undecaprenyl-diphosphatase
MTLLKLLILAIVQGAAELLPVSSSAHVIVAEKLMGLDPTAPEMTLLLVMLHTGTMFAVIGYFWSAWRRAYFGSMRQFRQQATLVVLATLATGVIGLGLQSLIKHLLIREAPNFEIESLFGNAKLMASALVAAALLILLSSRLKDGSRELSNIKALAIGAVQGLCLPFRGFSRSGATISTGLLLGASRRRAEEFSFALAVVLTPAVIVREYLRVLKAAAFVSTAGAAPSLWTSVGPGLLGMGLSFASGLVALRLLSHWLEHGRWHFFGVYCLMAAGIVLWVG